MASELTCVCRRRLASGFELDAELRLPLERAAITVLFGPSGAGKTTLLRMIAGLDRPGDGEICFRGESWFDAARGVCLPPQQRRAGYVAQDYALFPHLTVAANIAYAARPGRGAEHLKAFGLGELAGRYPRAISSGQRQRVALARALAAEPAVLLLDEPLSALDAATRTRTREQLRQLLLTAGVPSLIVTHDRMEAVALGDWIAVMTEGKVRQSGPVDEVFQRPADAHVAESLGVENVLPAKILGRSAGLLSLETGGAQLQAVDSGEEGAVVACIRAEDVAITREPPHASSIRNRLAGRVAGVTIEGPLARVTLECGVRLVSLITAQSARELELKPGDEVCAILKTTSIHLAAHPEGRK
jgi:molybdate transport system ATP-binding protein